ncbi:hypothetical protein C1894_17730 [Pseudomonas sp. FW305-3-2-15-E-TSA2]|nr:hypothetical protein C1894_17730 [Pseudomonas sp. FW305-3-2-15-E-TSA2]
MLTSGKNLDRQFNRIGRGRFALGHLPRGHAFGGSGLAREGVGTFRISMSDTPLSRASPLLQGRMQ